MPVTLIRSAAGFALLTVIAAGCGTAGATHSAGVQGQPASSAGRGTAVGQVPSSAPGTASAAALSACSLLTPADIMAVAAAFPSDTVTIDRNQQHNTPPASECGFNQKGVYTGNGMTNTSSGDHWAQLTVITGGASYAFNPAGNDTISGLGDGAYWDAGTHTVVIRKGQNVLQVIDEVPVNLSASPDLATAYRHAAQALATKILTHV
ncbi:MAG TPA: hypothetical protein VGA04_26140 [Streptosporangiaceae bacterium]